MEYAENKEKNLKTMYGLNLKDALFFTKKEDVKQQKVSQLRKICWEKNYNLNYNTQGKLNLVWI